MNMLIVFIITNKLAMGQTQTWQGWMPPSIFHWWI